LSALAQQQPMDLREAARLDQAGRCEESEKIYQRALAQGVPGPALLNNTGNHYLACGAPEKAREFFERLVKAMPAHLNGNLQLARMEIAAGAFARAEDRLTKLAATHPDDFDLLLLLGRAAARAGHAAKARQTLESALQLGPDDASAMLEAGLANAASGDYPRAVFLLARAQSRAPDQPGIALALARASEDAGYYGDAVIAYDRYLSLATNDGSARRDRARALALTIIGRERGARDLEDYVNQNPGDPLGYFYSAQVRWKEDADGALARLAEAVKLDPRLAPAHVARAWLLHRFGRDDEALTHLAAALKVSPDDVRALDLTGVALLSLDRVREAETVLRKAAALAPSDAEVALHLGRSLMDQGKDQEGQRWLNAYQKLRPPRQRDARREAGMIELATLDPAGRRAREIERFRSMARSRPDDPLLQLHLAGLLLADGQHEEALREYRLLEELNGDKDIWAQAGRALADAGEHDAARRFLDRAGLPLEAPEAEKALQSAIDLALKGGAVAALEQIRRVESKWPEWARPWLVHGLLLREARRAAEAESKFRTAAALGSREDVSACATLREWVSGSCPK
jgi:Flp pilus assembly protein TadD